MKQHKLFAWTATLLISIIFSQPTQGQDPPSEKTVREKITTVRETITTTRESSITDSRQKTRLVAIFVKNRAGRAFDDKLGVFEDLVTAEITDMGFQVMSPEDTVKAVRSFLGTELDQSVPGGEAR